MERIARALELSKNEEDFQSVALLCREAAISLAQAVYDHEKHGTLDGVSPSSTDAKRMLESYIVKEVGSQSPSYSYFRYAAICAEATRALVNAIAILSGQRDS